MMVPGGAPTAACLLSKHDGRPGWAHEFVQAGHPVRLPDWPGTGRSGYGASTDSTSEVVCARFINVIASVSRPVVVLAHSLSGANGWKLLEQVGDRITRIMAVAPSTLRNVQPHPDVVTESSDSIEIRGPHQRGEDFKPHKGKPILIVTGTDDVAYPCSFDAAIAE